MDKESDFVAVGHVKFEVRNREQEGILGELLLNEAGQSPMTLSLEVDTALTRKMALLQLDSSKTYSRGDKEGGWFNE